MFLKKLVLKICSKFTGEHSCQIVISIKLQNNFIEITLRHRCFPLPLLHIFRIPFSKHTSGELLLMVQTCKVNYLVSIRFVYNYFTLKLLIFDPPTSYHHASSWMITRSPLRRVTPEIDHPPSPLYHLFLFFEVEKKIRTHSFF